MNPPDFPAGGSTPPSSKKEIPLQGPRPSPLRVSKESHKIKKPPLPPPAAAHHPSRPETEEASQQQWNPVIIYSVSPKVIHVPVSDFMDVVQRLTGLPPRDKQISGSGDVSPAARLASIEKTSPSEKDRLRTRDDTNHTIQELEGVEMGQFPGILSPAPATLQPIPSEYFSPATDFQTLPFQHELSPFWSGNSLPQTLSFQQELGPFWAGNSFMGSPSGLLPGSTVSPIPSPDLFNLFD